MRVDEKKARIDMRAAVSSLLPIPVIVLLFYHFLLTSTILALFLSLSLK